MARLKAWYTKLRGVLQKRRSGAGAYGVWEPMQLALTADSYMAVLSEAVPLYEP